MSDDYGGSHDRKIDHLRTFKDLVRAESSMEKWFGQRGRQLSVEGVLDSLRTYCVLSLISCIELLHYILKRDQHR